MSDPDPELVLVRLLLERAGLHASQRASGVHARFERAGRMLLSLLLREALNASQRTTISDARAPCPLDRVNRQFKAERPNQLRVSDFTYVSTWQGWLYVAFVIDACARRMWAGG